MLCDGRVVGHPVSNGRDERLTEGEDAAAKGVATVSSADGGNYVLAFGEQTRFMACQPRARVVRWWKCISADEELGSQS
jgi:hypothetical protein